MIKKIVYLFSIVLLFSLSSFAQQKNKPASLLPVIQINTVDSTVKINNQVLKSYQLKDIEKIIGKPDRIKTDTLHTYEEIFGTKMSSPGRRPIIVISYYYIYDNLGIMFYTQNSRYQFDKDPTHFSVHFANKRTFTHTGSLPYSPINFFKGVLQINGEILNPDKKLILESLWYNTKEVKLWNISFGLTSFETNIDGLYSIDTDPYLQLFLDNEKKQQISYIIVN